jgi:hypothetical protein
MIQMKWKDFGSCFGLSWNVVLMVLLCCFIGLLSLVWISIVRLVSIRIFVVSLYRLALLDNVASSSSSDSRASASSSVTTGEEKQVGKAVACITTNVEKTLWPGALRKMPTFVVADNGIVALKRPLFQMKMT